MTDKFTLDQLLESKTYRDYGYILMTVLDSNKTYTLAEVNKRLAKYIK